MNAIETFLTRRRILVLAALVTALSHACVIAMIMELLP